jgi:hypothetical protein
MKAGAVVVATLAAGAYVLHQIGRRSGVTTEELRSSLPGDDIVRLPMWQSTRAITIDASPDEVWPWVVQMGFPSHRAGWHTPHWLDRLTFDIKQPSADEIRADLQRLEPGDRVPDSEDWSVYFTVVTVDPPRARRPRLNATHHEADQDDRLQLGVRARAARGHQDSVIHPSAGELPSACGGLVRRDSPRARRLCQRRRDAARDQVSCPAPASDFG